MGEEGVGGVAHFADMKKIDRWIKFGTGGNRGAAERDRLAEAMGPVADFLDLAALNMHAADEDGVRPGKITLSRWRDIFIAKAHLPAVGQSRRHDQKPLGRHEGAQARGDVIGVFERAERRFVARKNAKNPSCDSYHHIHAKCSRLAQCPSLERTWRDDYREVTV